MPGQSTAADLAMPAERPYPDALSRMASLLSEAVTRVMPNSAAADWQSRITPVIESTLARFELVPRDEFERQVAEVERLHGELARLEARIGALEKR
jgi:BMFP domain-containing protein YqiC